MLFKVWIFWIAVLLNLHGAYDDKLWLPHYRDCFLLTGKHQALHCGDKHFETVATDRWAGFYMLATAERKASLFMCQGLQLFIFDSAAEKRALAKTLSMKSASNSEFSIFLRHGLLPHVKTGWEETHSLCFHLNYIPSHITLQDAIAFACGAPFSISPSKTHLTDYNKVIAPNDIISKSYGYGEFH